MSQLFHPTPHQWMRLSQLFGCGAAALASIAIGRAAGSRTGTRIVMPALAFFAIAFITRWMLQETQSRLQIVAFVAAAAFLEWIRSRRLDRPFGAWRWVCNASAAALGVLLAKHLLEPGSIEEFVLRALERAGIAAPGWLDPEA